MKMNYEVCGKNSALGSSVVLELCVREGQANGLTMAACVGGMFGTRHAYNKPQMCRPDGQKCMQHISQFEP